MYWSFGLVLYKLFFSTQNAWCFWEWGQERIFFYSWNFLWLFFFNLVKSLGREQAFVFFAKQLLLLYITQKSFAPLQSEKKTLKLNLFQELKVDCGSARVPLVGTKRRSLWAAGLLSYSQLKNFMFFFKVYCPRLAFVLVEKQIPEDINTWKKCLNLISLRFSRN